MNFIRITVNIILLLLIAACSGTIPVCPPNFETGNPGGTINSHYDEFSPIIDDSTLVFYSARQHKGIYFSHILNNTFQNALCDTFFSMNKFPNTAFPAFCVNPATKAKEVFFAATVSENKKKNTQLLFSEFTRGAWSKPKFLRHEINTPFIESYPSVSPDGKLLVFASDRPDGFGGLDIYSATRRSDGSWGDVKNLGKEINTPKDEISPNISSGITLYFASNGYGTNSGFDIVKSAKNGDGSWEKVSVLSNIINTKSNEIHPFYFNENLFFSSDKYGGCGGYDIYSVALCGPVVAEGEIISPDNSVVLDGKLELTSTDGAAVYEVPVGAEGHFRFNIRANKSYILQYINNCMPNARVSQSFVAPCSDSSTVELKFKFILPENKPEESSEEFKLPFFVTGYYMPNTKENLVDLRLKLAYNLIGTDDSTKYIENPGEIYDLYAGYVENNLDSIVGYILSKCGTTDDECLKSQPIINIKITGFSDSRPLPEASLYNGNDIDDPEFDIVVSNGEPIDNQLLSILRAYFTAKELMKHLEKNNNYSKIQDRILWNIKGVGSDDNPELGDELKRRVDIIVEIK